MCVFDVGSPHTIHRTPYTIHHTHQKRREEVADDCAWLDGLVHGYAVDDLDGEANGGVSWR